MADSGLDDTFGSRVGLTTIIFAAVLAMLFTWAVFAMMGGQSQRASQDLNTPGYPAANPSLPLRY